MNRNPSAHGKERLDQDSLRRILGKSLFSTRIHLYGTLPSTNRMAKEMAVDGAPEGTLILAERQTAGRGRMDRQWLSPGYVNLLFSCLLRPPLQAKEVFALTMLLALAAIDGVRDTTGVETRIKWPNDIYAGEKKLGGILTEFSVKGLDVAWVVLGLGLNVNWSPTDTSGLLYPATNLSAETGTHIPRLPLLAAILKEFEIQYKMLLEGEREVFYQRWNACSMILGHRVEIVGADGKIKGRASHIDHTGALILLDDHNREVKILCGDVSVRL